MPVWTEYSHDVAQAAGMVVAQADCTFDEAFALMNERALLLGQNIEDFAATVVTRRTRFR